jgi:hypothetical protein
VNYKILFDSNGNEYFFEEVAADFYPQEDPDEFALFMARQHIERAMTDLDAEGTP